MLQFVIETLRLGMTNVVLHKLRSFLTALGIIFGVSAVIVMVAIGEGNKQVALEKIRQLGARNIIVSSVKPAEPPSMGQETQRMAAYGIQRRDVRRIEQLVRGMSEIVPLKRVGSDIWYDRYKCPGAAFGTLPELAGITSLRVERGRYLTDVDVDELANVAVIGASVAERLFPMQDPLLREIRIDSHVFKVVGVLRPVGLAGGAGASLVGRDLNFDVHIPMTTADARFGDMNIRRSSGSMEATLVEISELYIQADSEEHVLPVAEQVRLIMDKEHAAAGDVTTFVPLELLEQERSTRMILDALLVAIAFISLLVGGIGIMNIMLASVTERTREIGIRRAVGATRTHVIAQFLAETTVLASVGGLLGVLLGLSSAGLLGLLHDRVPGLEMPVVPMWSVMFSFIVATSVGIIFGLYPAIRAAQQDPIVALRHD